MQLNVQDDLAFAANLSEGELRLTLALALFEAERLTLAQAARLAGLDRLAFQRQLAARGIALHYGEEDFAADLRTLERL